CRHRPARATGRRRTEMTDRYERIRAALAMGPTPGPWAAHPDIGTPVGTLKIAPPIWDKNTFNVPLIAAVYGTGVTQPANAALIAACDPDTIRELLADRDALREALEMMVEMVEMNGFGRDYAMDVARAALGQDKGSGYWPEMPKNGGPDWTGFDG